MIKLSISGDIQKLVRHLRETERRLIPAATAAALNHVASTARQEAVREVSRKLKLPQRFIRKRFNLQGDEKGDRIVLVRANRSRQAVVLQVYVRGLPVGQIATAQTKQGVRGKGGRLYRGAFRVGPMVFKRRGKERLPLTVPKIGLRKALEGFIGPRMVGAEGARRFRVEFAKRLDAALARVR